MQALELGMNFCTEDMNATLAVKLRRRLGLGMWAKLHLLGMHVEGKVSYLKSTCFSTIMIATVMFTEDMLFGM